MTLRNNIYDTCRMQPTPDWTVHRNTICTGYWWSTCVHKDSISMRVLNEETLETWAFCACRPRLSDRR